MRRILCETVVKGLKDPASLNAIETATFYSMFNSTWWGLQNMSCQMREGTLDDRFWHSYKCLMIDLVNQPGVKAHWQARKHWMMEEFQYFVDDEILDAPTTPGYKPWGVVEDKPE